MSWEEDYLMRKAREMERRVSVLEGMLKVALWKCTNCTTIYAVGLEKCPECGSSAYVEDGATPSDSEANGPSTSAVVPSVPDDPDAEEDGESWDGDSSQTSTSKPESNVPQNPAPPQPPVPTTENPSDKGQTASSTARSTGGGKTAQ